MIKPTKPKTKEQREIARLKEDNDALMRLCDALEAKYRESSANLAKTETELDKANVLLDFEKTACQFWRDSFNSASRESAKLFTRWTSAKKDVNCIIVAVVLFLLTSVFSLIYIFCL